MKAATCLLALLPILGAYSAQLAPIPAEGAYAAPLDYGQMKAPIVARDEHDVLLARDPKNFRSLFGKKKQETLAKRDEEEGPAKNEKKSNSRKKS